jgi:hypothetical protein
MEVKDPGLPPVREALRSHPIAYLEAIDHEIDQLLKIDLTEPCNSPCASNLALFKKEVMTSVIFQLDV